MKILKPSHFEHYFKNSTDRTVAASIANEVIEDVLFKILEDPTSQSIGKYSEGFRDALEQIKYELGGLK